MKQELQEQVLTKNGSLELATAEYARLHEEVIRNRSDATFSLVKMMSALSRMCDSKAFEVAGFESFGDYSEKAAGIKERQAYNYVKVYKEYGEDYLKENAQLGVTKLLLLATAPEEQRAEIAEEHDIENESVRELKAALAAKDEDVERAERVLNEIKSTLRERNYQIEDLKTKMDAAKTDSSSATHKNELADMKTQIEVLQKQCDIAEAARVAAEQAAKKAAEAIAPEAEKEIETVYVEDEKSKKLLADATAELDKVRSELEKAQVTANEKLIAAEQALSEKQIEAEKLIKKLEIANDEVMSRFAVKFEDLQKVAAECDELIGKMTDSTKAEKCRNAIRFAIGGFYEKK